MLNNLNLTGNLGADPEVKHSKDGKMITTFNLAFYNYNTRQKTGWIRVVTFDKLAEIAEKQLSKGSRAVISGRLEYQKWDDAQGQKRFGYQFVCSMLDVVKKSNGNGSNGSASSGPAPSDDVDDDIPF